MKYLLILLLIITIGIAKEQPKVTIEAPYIILQDTAQYHISQVQYLTFSIHEWKRHTNLVYSVTIKNKRDLVRLTKEQYLHLFNLTTKYRGD